MDYRRTVIGAPSNTPTGLNRAPSNAAAAAVGWVLPSVGLQVALPLMAGTDMQAHLAYRDRIRGYHERLRQFFYSYLFTDKPFVKSDYESIPPFEPGE